MVLNQGQVIKEQVQILFIFNKQVSNHYFNWQLLQQQQYLLIQIHIKQRKKLIKILVRQLFIQFHFDHRLYFFLQKIDLYNYIQNLIKCLLVIESLILINIFLYYNFYIISITVKQTRNKLCKELRHKKSPNDQQSFGLIDDFLQENLQKIQSLKQRRKQSVDLKHQRAKSTLDNQQHSYRLNIINNQLFYYKPISNKDEQDGEKLFDQFFKLNNSKSDSDFMKDSMQRETNNKNQEQQEFLKFVENAIEYHKQSEVRFFRQSTNNKHSHLEQKLKETTISNRLLVNQLNQYKQKEIELKHKLKLMQKEFSIQYSRLIQQNAWLEELLAKQKIDNQNSLLAVKKAVEMLQIRCKCQKGIQLYDKILRDVKNSEKIRQQYEWEQQSYKIQSSSEFNNSNEDEQINEINFQLFEKNQKKSISKVQHNSIQSTEDQQEQLVHSYIQGTGKNLREYTKDLTQKKKQLQEPYYIEEENTINSN